MSARAASKTRELGPASVRTATPARAAASPAEEPVPPPAATTGPAPHHGTLEVVFLGGLFLFAFVGTLIVARPVLVPMVAAALLAMTLMPAVNRLRRWGAPHAVAVTIVAIAVVVALALVAWLLVEPLGNALAALPLLDGLGQRLARISQRVFGAAYTDWAVDRLREAVPSANLSAALFGERRGIRRAGGDHPRCSPCFCY